MSIWQECIECNEQPLANCFVTNPGDGPGIADADFVLYVTALNGNGCGPNSGVIAFAAACEMEQVLDRYR